MRDSLMNNNQFTFQNFFKKKQRSLTRGLHSGRGPFQSTEAYPGGLLPTLGLNRYRNQDLSEDQINPFTVHKNTEKLFVVRERERQA